LNKEYYYSRGIIDVLDFYTKKENRLTTPVTFEDVSDDFKLSVAFAYSNKIEDENILSFCNTIRTSEHGTHVTGFKRVISQYLTQYIKDKKLVKEEIINEDVFSGLEAVISIFSFEPKYSSQTKQRLENKEINGYVFKVAFKYIQAWLNENPKEIQKLANKFALVAKARIAAKKALDTVRKDANALSIPLNLSKFSDCLSNSASDECELWIVEGASAGGSIKDARNKFNQALYELKGKPLNCLNRDVNSVLDNIEMGSLFNNILGIGLKDKADLSKTKFTKIIIASDADSDGLHIQLLMIANLLEFLPTLIEDGRLYIAQPPLYRISSGKNLTFLQTTEELNDFLLQEAVKNVQFVYNGKVVKKNVEGIFKQLLTYQKKCTEIAKKYSINPSILELAFINTFDLDEISFDLPEKLFHESENLTVSGFYKHSSGNEYYITLINADVESFIEDITLLHTDYFDLISNLDFQGIKTNNPSLIGKFTDLIDLVNKKNNIIRLKGLGETESDDLKVTTMDPATRKLVQVTYDTIENAIEVCNQYMNPHKKFVGFRKQFIVDMFEEVFDKEKCNE
jgi:DNA gyrase subunit B